MASIQKPPVYRVPLAQLTVLLPICLALGFVDSTAAYSALLGGIVCVIPNAYFAIYAFRYAGARAAHAIARAFFWGEAGKFALTVVGFGAVFVLVKPLNSVALFSAYGGMVIVQWVVSASLSGRHREPRQKF